MENIHPYYCETCKKPFSTGAELDAHAEEHKEKAKRLEQIENELDRLIQEYYLLVAPTADENEVTSDMVQDDAIEYAAMLLDKGTWYGKLFLAGEAVDQRLENQNPNKEDE